MQAILSPGSLVTIAGAVLTVIGTIAYATDIPNLSLPNLITGLVVGSEACVVATVRLRAGLVRRWLGLRHSWHWPVV